MEFRARRAIPATGGKPATTATRTTKVDVRHAPGKRRGSTGQYVASPQIAVLPGLKKQRTPKGALCEARAASNCVPHQLGKFLSFEDHVHTPSSKPGALGPRTRCREECRDL